MKRTNIIMRSIPVLVASVAVSGLYMGVVRADDTPQIILIEDMGKRQQDNRNNSERFPFCNVKQHGWLYSKYPCKIIYRGISAVKEHPL